METVILWIVGVLLFLFILSFSVGAHEAAHMAFGKLFKMEVPKYFIGFGPKIWSHKTSKTEYGLKALPLGGYVVIKDPSIADDKDPNKELLSNVHPFKRIVIFSAGAIINLVLGVLITALVLLTVPTQTVSTIVQSAPACSKSEVSCGAKSAGIQPGDKVVSVNGRKVADISEISTAIHGKNSVSVIVERNGGRVSLADVAVKDGKIGIVLKTVDHQKTAPQAFGQVGEVFRLNAQALASLPSKVPGIVASLFGAPRDENGLSSVVAVGKAYGDTASSQKISLGLKVQTMMLYAGLINIGVGIMNLLPIPPLDGGRVFFAFIDWIRMAFAKIFRKKYSPLDKKYIMTTTAVAGVFVFGFMALLVLADIISPINMMG